MTAAPFTAAEDGPLERVWSSGQTLEAVVAELANLAEAMGRPVSELAERIGALVSGGITRRRDIPAFTCKEGCGECCGPVFWTLEEWHGVCFDAAARKITPKVAADGFYTGLDEGTCPFLEDGKTCAVHDRRPMLCRLFGAVDEDKWRCPHGCAPDDPLSADEGRAVLKLYLFNAHVGATE